jgi:MFS family permease
MEESTVTTPAVSRWWVLFLVHFSVLAFALNFQMIPPLLPSLISSIGLTHTQAGTLMGLFTLPGIFLALPGGRVSDALGPRSVALWSLALLTVGPFLMLPLHPWFLYAGRLCSGVGGAVLVVVAPQIIARFFHGRELGLAMGIFNTAVPVGTILAFNVLGSLATRLSIHVVLVITACFSFLSLGAFFLTYADPVQESFEMSEVGRGTVNGLGTIRGLGKGIWLISLVWVLFNISILAYFTFTIDHFIASGMNGPTARFLSSLPMLLSIFLTPVVGFSIHRYGLRWSLPLIGCAISSAAILLVMIPDSTMIITWSILLGIGISMVPPAVFTIAGEVVPPSRTGTGFGLMTTIFNLGVFLGIPLVGHAKDLTSTYTYSFILMAIIMAMGAATGAISIKLVPK